MSGRGQCHESVKAGSGLRSSFGVRAWIEMEIQCVNPLSPNVADLQHFDIELFFGFSLNNAFCPSAEFLTVGLLVLPLSQPLVIKVG